MESLRSFFNQNTIPFGGSNEVWLLLGAGLVFVCLLSYLGYRVMKAKLLRHTAEKRLKHWQIRFKDQFQEVPELMDQVSLLFYATEVYTGKTSELIHKAVGEADDLYLKTRCGFWLIEQVEKLIYPSGWRCRIFNFFSDKRFEQAIQLLENDSIGFDSVEKRMQILYSNSSDVSFRNLLGREDDYAPFSIGSNQLLSSYADCLSHTKGVIDRVEQSIEQLPVWLSEVGNELDGLGRQIHRLVSASNSDGFFPLTNLQEKLLPSVINLIDECIRQGAMDPVSAYESAAQLAMRQIKDIRLITNRIERLRTHDFPKLEAIMGEFQDVDPMSYTWIDQEMIAHSQALESVCNHAVLWSVSGHIDTFSKHLDESLERARLCTKIAKGQSLTLSGWIDDVEKDYRKVRFRLSKSIGLAEEALFTDVWSSPENQIKLMRESHQLMGDALSCGQIQIAQSKAVFIQQTIAEVRDILDVAERISQVGKDVLNHVETRYCMLSERLDRYRDLLSDLQSNYHSDVFKINGEGLSSSSESIAALLTQIEATLPKIGQSLISGQFLAAGRWLDEVRAELRFGELKVEAVEQLYDSISLTVEECEKRHADARFRHRSIDIRMEDRRTRQETLDRYDALTHRIEWVEQQLNRSEAINPFQVQSELDEIFVSIEQLEDRASIDWDWYELASVSIKSAARTLRSCKTQGFSESGLKQQIDKWQDFLEQQHNDWYQAYQAGFEIELEVLGELPESVVQMMREACQSFKDLADWENVAGIQLDRRAGRDRFDQARSYLLTGDIQKAIAQATLANQESRSELSAAITRQQFVVFELAGRRRRQDMVAILPDATVEEAEFGALTPKSMQVVQPLNAHHLRGFKSRRFALPEDNIVEFPDGVLNQDLLVRSA